MLSRLRSALTYANMMSTLAVFLTLGGAAYAATTLRANSVGTKQIKNGAVTKKKISASARAALRGNTGPRGPAGSPASYPKTLPSGRTQTGVFAVRFTATASGQSADAEVSFPLPLSSAPKAGYGGTNSQCTGSVTDPTASAGWICFYFGQTYNVDSVIASDPSGNDGMSKYGGLLTTDSYGTGDTILRGTWAVTAS